MVSFKTFYCFYKLRTVFRNYILIPCLLYSVTDPPIDQDVISICSSTSADEKPAPVVVLPKEEPDDGPPIAAPVVVLPKQEPEDGPPIAEIEVIPLATATAEAAEAAAEVLFEEALAHMPMPQTNLGFVLDGGIQALAGAQQNPLSFIQNYWANTALRPMVIYSNVDFGAELVVGTCLSEAMGVFQSSQKAFQVETIAKSYRCPQQEGMRLPLL